MFKKFSVEWLSQSFHAQDLEQEKRVKLIPSAPDAFSDAPRASSEMLGEGETKAPSSPTSKYDLLAVVFWVGNGSNRLFLSQQTAVATPRPLRAMRAKENPRRSGASEPSSARIRSRAWRRPSANTSTSERLRDAEQRRSCSCLRHRCVWDDIFSRDSRYCVCWTCS